jgi:CDP-glycerol glycerophosphotransferase
LEEQMTKYSARREQFTAEFGEYDRGTAARSIVDEFFAQWRRG